MSAAKYFRNWAIAVASVYVCVLVSLLVWGGKYAWELFVCTWYVSSWVEKRTAQLRMRAEIERTMGDKEKFNSMISDLQRIVKKAGEVKRGD